MDWPGYSTTSRHDSRVTEEDTSTESEASMPALSSSKVIGKMHSSRVRVVGVDTDANGLELSHNEFIHRLEAGESIADLASTADIVGVVLRRGETGKS